MTQPAKLNGCHNRPPFKPTVEVREVGGYRIATAFPFRMAMDCQYTRSALGQADQRCEGCKHRVTEKEAA
jgi:hypothetical protein